MYFNDNWCFLAELKAFPGEAAETVGIVSVDLSEEDDRGDIEPSRDAVSGELRCLIGKDDEKSYVTRIINECVHKKLHMLINDTPTAKEEKDE